MEKSSIARVSGGGGKKIKLLNRQMAGITGGRRREKALSPPIRIYACRGFNNTRDNWCGCGNDNAGGY